MASMGLNQSNLVGPGVAIGNTSMMNEGVLAAEDPQNVPMTPADITQGAAEFLDPEFLQEIEVYLIECRENGEPSIDMSDTLIGDQGARMVAAVAAFCENLQELRLQ